MSRNYNYAMLGNSCQTNANELIDNTKFFKVNSEIYKPSFTNTHKYPGESYDITQTIPDLDYPEQLKVNGRLNFDLQKVNEKEQYKKGCCGN
jgi:hypothetical protein